MERPRKKLRRTVNSCLECRYGTPDMYQSRSLTSSRRRKIRCDLNTNSSNSCSACASRNIACESWQSHDEGTDTDESDLNARLQRVERLLDALTQADESSLNQRTPLPTGSVSTPIEGDDNPPVISLFDNAIVSRSLGPSTILMCLVWSSRKSKSIARECRSSYTALYPQYREREPRKTSTRLGQSVTHSGRRRLDCCIHEWLGFETSPSFT